MPYTVSMLTLNPWHCWSGHAQRISSDFQDLGSVRAIGQSRCINPKKIKNKINKNKVSTQKSSEVEKNMTCFGKPFDFNR